MAKFVFGMNQSLDGYIDHQRFPSAPSPMLFRQFIDQTESLSESLQGRRLYESMRYWDSDQPDWTGDMHAFARAWRKNPKWAVSQTLETVIPNVTLLGADIQAEILRIKIEVDGEIKIGGPELARSMSNWGLIDEYRIYLHAVVLGHGTPFFAASVPPLRLVDTQRFEGDVIRLIYVP